MTYKITYRYGSRHLVFAGGFASVERAQRWMELYNAQNGFITRTDLVIVPESVAA